MSSHALREEQDHFALWEREWDSPPPPPPRGPGEDGRDDDRPQRPQPRREMSMRASLALLIAYAAPLLATGFGLGWWVV